MLVLNLTHSHLIPGGKKTVGVKERPPQSKYRSQGFG